MASILTAGSFLFADNIIYSCSLKTHRHAYNCGLFKAVLECVMHVVHENVFKNV